MNAKLKTANAVYLYSTWAWVGSLLLGIILLFALQWLPDTKQWLMKILPFSVALFLITGIGMWVASLRLQRLRASMSKQSEAK